MRDNYFTYRLLIVPETIGPLAYLSNNGELIENIFGGYVITCAGDKGNMTYKKSIYGDHIIDKMMQRALKDTSNMYNVVSYDPFGSDERQYSSPLLRLPFGSLMRSSHTSTNLSNSNSLGNFPEYHTSLDNLDVVHEDCMQEVKNVYLKCLKYLEMNRYYKANYIGEPFLSKHGLYISPSKDMESYLATFYLCGYADGNRSLWDIQEISGVSIEKLKTVAESFERKGLVKIVG
jgi:aminopeptidase-like protein